MVLADFTIEEYLTFVSTLRFDQLMMFYFAAYFSISSIKRILQLPPKIDGLIFKVNVDVLAGLILLNEYQRIHNLLNGRIFLKDSIESYISSGIVFLLILIIIRIGFLSNWKGNLFGLFYEPRRNKANLEGIKLRERDDPDRTFSLVPEHERHQLWSHVKQTKGPLVQTVVEVYVCIALLWMTIGSNPWLFFFFGLCCYAFARESWNRFYKYLMEDSLKVSNSAFEPHNKPKTM